jgi:hypothetical protein
MTIFCSSAGPTRSSDLPYWIGCLHAISGPTLPTIEARPCLTTARPAGGLDLLQAVVSMGIRGFRKLLGQIDDEADGGDEQHGGNRKIAPGSGRMVT